MSGCRTCYLYTSVIYTPANMVNVLPELFYKNYIVYICVVKVMFLSFHQVSLLLFL